MKYYKPQELDFKTRVFETIDTNDIKAYSKVHFTLRMILLIVVSFLILIVSICIFSYICFSVRTSGHISLLGFNLPSIVLFLQFFPWTQLIVDIILVSILQWLLRNFRFGYHIPVLYLLLILFVLTSITGYAVYLAGFNEMLLRQGNQDHLPFHIENLYRK